MGSILSDSGLYYPGTETSESSAEMSELLPNSWTDFLSNDSNEAPIDEVIPNTFDEVDDIDILLHYPLIQSSTGYSIDYRPFGYSSHSSSALFQNISTHSLPNSPHNSIQELLHASIQNSPHAHASIQDSPYTSIQGSPRTSIQDSPRTSIQNSPSVAENSTPSSSPPPPVPALSNDSHLSLKYRCNIRGCRNRSGFTSLKSRLVHARKVHKTRFFCSCPGCPWVHTYSSFSTKEALDEHWRVYHPNVSHFRCSECSYTTDNVTNIQLKHLNVHFKEEGDISEAMVRIRQEKGARRGRRRGQVESD
ncbi:hypothetical protein P167DRAFT_608230 [Morchella conica CCBAS932]|uniref:C2H2-type domain-containing protein n=1 Tax=Morchella conica CCBAS932 TaxID=1392247 RepID=A0A3N4KIF4_9PEZI|nr:hypothetical protein P167DRAFT_608230 [Morchella conica CCBAS932]